MNDVQEKAAAISLELNRYMPGTYRYEQTVGGVCQITRVGESRVATLLGKGAEAKAVALPEALCMKAMDYLGGRYSFVLVLETDNEDLKNLLLSFGFTNVAFLDWRGELIGPISRAVETLDEKPKYRFAPKGPIERPPQLWPGLPDPFKNRSND